MAMMRLKRLTAQAFENSAADTRMGDHARGMARAVLVDGRSQVDVATEYGMTKQRVSGAVATIERAYKKITTPGESVIRVELDLPETLALELGVLIDALAQCRDQELQQAVIEKVLTACKSGRKRLSCP